MKYIKLFENFSVRESVEEITIKELYDRTIYDGNKGSYGEKKLIDFNLGEMNELRDGLDDMGLNLTGNGDPGYFGPGGAYFAIRTGQYGRKEFMINKTEEGFFANLDCRVGYRCDDISDVLEVIKNFVEEQAKKILNTKSDRSSTWSLPVGSPGRPRLGSHESTQRP